MRTLTNLIQISPAARHLTLHIAMRLVGLAVTIAILVTYRLTGHSLFATDLPTMLLGALACLGPASWIYALPGLVLDLRDIATGDSCRDCGLPYNEPDEPEVDAA